MATNTIKLKAQEENLSDANIKKVIGLLEPETGKPITKTLACQILCISYNVKRLDMLINKFKEQQEFRTKKLAENRGKPLSPEDRCYIIKEYLAGESMASIAKSLFRGTSIVVNTLEDNNVPIKPRTQDYFKPELIPDALVRKDFSVGEIVYSARYDSLAKIHWETKSVDGDKVYNVFLTDEKWQMHAYQPASELASLQNLRDIGIKI